MNIASLAVDFSFNFFQFFHFVHRFYVTYCDWGFSFRFGFSLALLLKMAGLEIEEGMYNKGEIMKTQYRWIFSTQNCRKILSLWFSNGIHPFVTL